MNKKKFSLKKYCFDIDGVICKTQKNFYHKSTPIKKNIKAINDLYSNGNKIMIFTARFMGRCNDNRNMAKKKAYAMTKNQLNKWGVLYHELIFGKPSFDVVVDDKSFFHDWNWSKKITKKSKLKRYK
tara:strand:- start:193 stop:573 length:381 start_codon:yes stop_codon:yes gene_type:complete